MNFRSREIQFQKPQFDPIQLSHQNVGDSGYASFFTNNVRSSPGYDQLAATNVATRYNERAAATKALGDLHSMGLSSLGAVKSAEIQAEAAENAAKSKANGQMVGSALQLVGSIGGALLMSDATTKENVEVIDDGLSLIKKLQPKTYNYKPEWQGYSNRKHSGFIAQEYQSVIPKVHAMMKRAESSALI